MPRLVLASVRLLVVMTVLCGLAYPMLVLGIGWAVAPDRANGSLVEVDGRMVGSSLLGQANDRPEYLHPRPSAAGEGYDATASGASNLGPSNPTLVEVVAERVAEYRAVNRLAADESVPIDAVTASASGLDPDISLANARLQAARVARAREVGVASVVDVIESVANRNWLGSGAATVNVLQANVALDRALGA